MTSNLDGFQQPIVFVFGSSEGGLILWSMSNDACSGMQEDTWCFVFCKGETWIYLVKC